MLKCVFEYFILVKDIWELVTLQLYLVDMRVLGNGGIYSKKQQISDSLWRFFMYETS